MGWFQFETVKSGYASSKKAFPFSFSSLKADNSEMTELIDGSD